MNYKTIMISALLSALMQNACAMDDGTKENIIEAKNARDILVTLCNFWHIAPSDSNEEMQKNIALEEEKCKDRPGLRALAQAHLANEGFRGLASKGD